MSQIEELQGRIANALDRISQGLDLQANTQPSDPAEITALQQALEDERTASQQLEERNKTLNERIAALEAELEDAKAVEPVMQDVKFPNVLADLGPRISKVRENNKLLRARLEKLRDSKVAAIDTPHLINAGLKEELDAMSAMRELDQAEMTAVLEMLQAVLGPTDATQGGV